MAADPRPDHVAAPEPNKDAELRAMLAILKYLEPLDRDARKRVLKWAEDRLTALRFDEQMDPEAPRKFFQAISEASRQMGNVTPLDIIRAVETISQMRDEAEPSEEVVADA